jgi:hypothetical protein
MKLTLDFDEPKSMKISASDDDLHSYRLVWKDDNMCSLWYDDNIFVWEKKYFDLSFVIGELLASMLNEMKSMKIVEY